MTDQALLAIAPTVSLLVLVGIVGLYFLWKERHEGREHSATNKRD